MRRLIDKAQLTAELAKRGPLSSADIQAHFGASQPTVSRLLGTMEDELVSIGKARSTVYALAEPIGRFAAQQSIWRMDAGGLPHRIGTLTFLARSLIHIEGPGVQMVFEPTSEARLPWFLSGLQAQGFLGRLLAQRLSREDIGSNPDQWSIQSTLVAALHTHDAPGALLLGTHAMRGDAPIIPVRNGGSALNGIASDITKTLPAGSCAGGEQPKFLALGEGGESYVVKFSPPRGTPFGERWNDLLCAEETSARLLQDCGIAAAPTRIVQTDTRTYLLSQRFDRTNNGGRKHVVSIGAAHSGFVKGPFRHWAETSEALGKTNALPDSDVKSAHDLRQFGNLIGNTDMHFGNLSLYCGGESLQDVLAGKFSLAPIYDMLPMRWRPDANLGPVDYQPFALDTTFADANIRRAARAFWASAAKDTRTSTAFQTVASTMAAKLQ